MTATEQLSRTILLCRDYVAEDLADDVICGAFQSVRVLCCSDLANLSSHSGQTTLVTLVSLVARMGIQVFLAIPDVEMMGPQPPLSGTTIKEGLTGLSNGFIDGARIESESSEYPDLVFAIGSTQIGERDAPCWRLCGDEWSGRLTPLNTSNSRDTWHSHWPIGAMVSALLGASEAFKLVMRRLPLRNEEDQVFFLPASSAHFDFGRIPVPAPDDDKIDLGSVDVISAGAISQAALFALLRVPQISISGRVFDDDETGSTNLNRNMLSIARDVGIAKVDVVAEKCRSAIQLRPVPSRFTEKSNAAGVLAPRVLVGVDDIPSRWTVQKLFPRWLTVSGTSHFSVSSSEHRPGQPCCGCLHAVDDPTGANPIPTVSFVSFWAGLAMAVRLLRYALGRPYSDDRQHLWMTPLRMDLRHAAIWLPVAPRRDCPVACAPSHGASKGFEATGSE